MVTALLNPPRVDPAGAMDPAATLRHSTRRHKAALIIPTLREAANIRVLLERVRAALDPTGIDYEILVIDDDSRDGIAETVAEISYGDPRVQLLVRQGKRGLSGAVLHGWMHTDAAIVGVMDADLQHPPELLPELIATMLAGCDLAIGSRYVKGGGLGSWNPIRKLISAVAVWVTWPIQRSGLRASDPMAGFFFVRRNCLNGVDFQEAGFKLLLEVLVRARIASVREVPFAFGRRFRGSSKADLKVAVDYGKLLARLYRYRFGWKRPVPISLFE